ncbi:MAG: phenylalanine--tRNA ligase subunit alpha, partial [Promethearchaeota archaeon]
KGLPERQMYDLFVQNDRKEISVDDFSSEVEKSLGLNKKLFFIGLTQMKKNKWVVSSKATGKDVIFLYSETSKPPYSPMEELLQNYGSKVSLSLSEIPKTLQNEVKNLTKRKLLVREKRMIRKIKLTPKGKDVKISDIQVIEEEVQILSSEMIKSGIWKEKMSSLKTYDVAIEGPRVKAGKFHPMTIVKNQVREVFHSMGFEEIRGPIMELAFYNFDSLYQPQDHPAREMHDTFYIKHPAKGKLPKKEIVERIRAIHENGGDSGSTGWRYKWSKEIAKKLLLRTHTTATTVRHLAKVGLEKRPLPVKVFCIDRVFRNEKLDRTHLAELQQIDGIIIGENVTLSDLIGQITEFYKRMGFKKVVTRPGFFPYTEPSMEVSVYSEELGAWLEMGGSGIFRPEVTSAWGIKDPVRVLAWGLGLERLAMLKLKREDIRELYQSNLSWLREVSY